MSGQLRRGLRAGRRCLRRAPGLRREAELYRDDDDDGRGHQDIWIRAVVTKRGDAWQMSEALGAPDMSAMMADTSRPTR